MFKKLSRFFSMLFMQTLATFFAGLMFFALTVGIIVVLMMRDGGELGVTPTKKKPVLVLELGKEIVEKEDEYSLLYGDIGFLSKFQKMGLSTLIKVIRKATDDDAVKMIYLRLDNFNAGWATVSDLYTALVNFKKKGKLIYSYAENYDEKSYYLASVAHKIFLYPAGMFELNGLMSNQVFFKGLFEKAKVHPQIFRVGKFKSAVEPFYLDKLGKEARIQNQEMLDDFWSIFIEKIQHNRQLSPQLLDKIVHDTPFLQPYMAKDHKLVDEILAESDLIGLIQKKHKQLWDSERPKKEVPLLKNSAVVVPESSAGMRNIDESELEKKYDPESLTRFWNESTMSWSQYARILQIKDMTGPKFKNQGPDKNKKKIAVVYIVGEIMDGDSKEGQTGSATTVETLRELGDNKDVKAIVLRISSPGGSASASDVIWSEIRRIKKFKPVIASMGDMAASGAYYIAAATDKIFARSNTITGSIGVFGIMISAEEFFNSFLGVTFDTVVTAPYADTTYTQRLLRKDEQALIQNQVEITYQRFLQRVEIGRPTQLNSLGQRKELAERVAEGRVWSGQRAKTLGLVDEIGGMTQALDYAAAMAKLEKDDYITEDYPKVPNPFQDFFSLINMKVMSKVMVWGARWSPEAAEMIMMSSKKTYTSLIKFYQRYFEQALPLSRTFFEADIH